jgi:hypothetical protein
LRLPEARAISAAAENIAHSLVASSTDSVVGNVFQHGKARAGDTERRLYFTEFTQWCSEVLAWEIITHRETFSTAIQPPYSSTKG